MHPVHADMESKVLIYNARHVYIDYIQLNRHAMHALTFTMVDRISSAVR